MPPPPYPEPVAVMVAIADEMPASKATGFNPWQKLPAESVALVKAMGIAAVQMLLPYMPEITTSVACTGVRDAAQVVVVAQVPAASTIDAVFMPENSNSEAIMMVVQLIVVDGLTTLARYQRQTVSEYSVGAQVLDSLNDVEPKVTVVGIWEELPANTIKTESPTAGEAIVSELAVFGVV